MEKAYKFRIYPNKRQRLLLAKTFGCVRYVYNYFLAAKEDLYKNTKQLEIMLERKLREDERTYLGLKECNLLLTELKRQHEWLKEPDKFALGNAMRSLLQGYDRFFKHISAHPKFKRKHDRQRSYQTNYTNGNILVQSRYIKLPKLGLVRYRDCRHTIDGKIINATISQEPSGKYYVSICCKDVPIPLSYSKTGNSVGIDLGIKEFLITSDGDKIENLRFLKKRLRILKRLQRGLSRKTIGGSRWEQNRQRLAVLHEKIRHMRLDFQQKLSTWLIKNYDIICVETLKVKNMIKNHKLAQAISDVSWSQFISLLEYKAKWNDKKLVKINTYFPSSQTCSKCGYINKEVKDLSVREWTCPNCGMLHDRDINATKNILAEGLNIA